MKKKSTKPVIVKISAEALDKNGYHIFLTTKLNDKKCRFLIDTGASHSVIDKTYFEKKLNEKKLKTVKQSTTGLHSSTTESHYGKIKTWAIGSFTIKSFTFAAIDLGHVNNTYKSLGKPKIQGILGSDILVKYKVIIDYGKLELIFG